jgi:hypothetical protein
VVGPEATAATDQLIHTPATANHLTWWAGRESVPPVTGAQTGGPDVATGLSRGLDDRDRGAANPHAGEGALPPPARTARPL